LILAVRDDPPPNCAATVIGRDTWYGRGALALRRTGSGFIVEGARSENYDRPWSPNSAPAWRAGNAPSSEAAGSTTGGAAPPDATPAPDDIEADQ
jgi:hypothetical protein